MLRTPPIQLALISTMTGLLALSGCATPPPPEGGVRIDNQNTTRPDLNSVRVIDGSLARYVGTTYKVDSVLDVESKTVSRTATGFSKITVEIRNKTNIAIPLQVRNVWYDEAGVPVDRTEAWTNLFTQPQSTVTFEQISIKQNATQYYVEVRGAQ